MIRAQQKKRYQSLSRLAEVYCTRGQYQNAESLYHQALSFAETTCGPEHIEVSTILNNLAVLYKYTGNFDEAELLYRRALAIVQKCLGADHPDVATIYHNMGGL